MPSFFDALTDRISLQSRFYDYARHPVVVFFGLQGISYS